MAWADRAALYQRAAALGLSRFDANLLMARVQHYHRQGVGDSGREWMWRASSSRWRGWSWLWGLLVLLGVLAMAWALTR